MPLDTALPPSGGSYIEGANVEWEDTAMEGRRLEAGQELLPLEEASKSRSKSHGCLSSWRQHETHTAVDGPPLVSDKYRSINTFYVYSSGTPTR